MVRERKGYVSTPDPIYGICMTKLFGYVSTPTHVSVVTASKRFVYVRTPAHMFAVRVIERIGCMSTPTHIPVIFVEVKYWLFEHSNSSVYYLCEKEVFLYDHF